MENLKCSLIIDAKTLVLDFHSNISLGMVESIFEGKLIKYNLVRRLEINLLRALAFILYRLNCFLRNNRDSSYLHKALE